jgi:hypothetical protein
LGAYRVRKAIIGTANYTQLDLEARCPGLCRILGVGRALVTVDLAEIEHKPLPARSPPDHPSVVETMQTRIEALETELAKVEAADAGHRLDFERERDRSDKLLSEVLRATLDVIGANEAAARAESELVVVRIQAEGERTAAMRVEARHAAGPLSRQRSWVVSVVAAD